MAALTPPLPATAVAAALCPAPRPARRLGLMPAPAQRSTAQPNTASCPQVFIESTQPVVSYYEGIGKVVRVDGSKTPEEVYATTRMHFDRFKACRRRRCVVPSSSSGSGSSCSHRLPNAFELLARSVHAHKQSGEPSRLLTYRVTAGCRFMMQA